MIAKVQEWGNSQGIRIPLSILREAKIASGQEVNLSVENEKIVIKATYCRKSIKELFAGYNEQYEPQEIDWGTPVGKEVW
jgi:antitoxin MazE